MLKRNASEESFFGLLTTAVALAYLLPTLIYITKGRPHIKFFFLTNLLTGWTIVGWAVLLGYVISAKANDKAPEASRSLLEEYELLTAQIHRK